MRLRAAVLLLSGLLAAFGGLQPARAESATVRPPAGRLEQRDPSPAPGPAAPVGHRQPQAKDAAPAEMPPADQATRDLDKALEKKLTICRGC
jgi:hypothetical protein